MDRHAIAQGRQLRRAGRMPFRVPGIGGGALLLRRRPLPRWMGVGVRHPGPLWRCLCGTRGKPAATSVPASSANTAKRSSKSRARTSDSWGWRVHAAAIAVKWSWWRRSVTAGRPIGQLVGQECAVGPLDHRDAAGRLLCRGFCPLVHSMAEQVVHTMVVSAADAGGERRLVETWVTPIFDTALGRVVGALEQFRPVEASEARHGSPPSGRVRAVTGAGAG